MVEIIVLGAIAIELFTLYNHSKLDNRLDKHILNTDRNLEKNEVMMKTFCEKISNFDEHMTRLDDVFWQSYSQKTENINMPQKSKHEPTKR